MHQLRLAHPLTAGGRVYADDPEPPELALSVAAVAVRIAAGALHLLVGEAVARVLAAPVAPGLREDLLAPPPPCDGVGRAGHLSVPSRPAGSGPASGPARRPRSAGPCAACA